MQGMNIALATRQKVTSSYSFAGYRIKRNVSTIAAKQELNFEKVGMLLWRTLLFTYWRAK